MFQDKCPMTFYAYNNDYNDFLIIRFMWQLSYGDVYACVLHLLHQGNGYHSITKRRYVIINFGSLVTKEIVDHLEDGIVLINNDFSFPPEIMEMLKAEGAYIPELNEKAMMSLIESGDGNFERMEL